MLDSRIAGYRDSLISPEMKWLKLTWNVELDVYVLHLGQSSALEHSLCNTKSALFYTLSRLFAILLFKCGKEIVRAFLLASLSSTLSSAAFGTKLLSQVCSLFEDGSATMASQSFFLRGLSPSGKKRLKEPPIAPCSAHHFEYRTKSSAQPN
jgi:hypothetical protein